MRVTRQFVLSASLVVAFFAHAAAEVRTFTVDVPSSKVDFTLGDVLHMVHGTFLLKSGTVTFDDVTGRASGEIVVDATSGESGSKARDHKMKKEILETDRFPDIVLKIQKIDGTVRLDGKSTVQLIGMMSIHGEDHPVTLSVPVTVSGATASADVAFPVPYVKWGLKNPSTFFLRVNDTVDIVVHAVGQISPASASLPR